MPRSENQIFREASREMSDPAQDTDLPVGKPPWLSRGVVGSVVVIASMLAGIYGWHVDSDRTTDIIMQAVGLIGGIIALYGRIKAEQPITWTRGTTPGGAFNPKAELRKTEAVFRKKDNGFAAIKALLLILAAYLFLAIAVSATTDIKFRSVSDVQCGGKPLAEWIQVVPVVDSRPFWQRLWSSLRVTPSVAVAYVDGTASVRITKIELKGGAEF